MNVSLQKLHRAEIIQLLKKPKKTTGFMLDLIYKDSLDPTLKTAVIVKPRVKSTQRNHVKRLVRQAFVELSPNITKGGLCIAVVKKTLPKAEKNIQAQLESLLKQSSFI